MLYVQRFVKDFSDTDKFEDFSFHYFGYPDETFLLFQKPRLLQLIFDKYVQAPKSVKQVFLIVAKVMLTIVVVTNPARLSVHIGQFSNSQMVRYLYLFYPRL